MKLIFAGARTRQGLPSVYDYRTFIDEFIAFLYAPEAEKLIADLAGRA